MRDFFFCTSVTLDTHHHNKEEPTEQMTRFMAPYMSVDSRLHVCTKAFEFLYGACSFSLSTQQNRFRIQRASSPACPEGFLPGLEAAEA
jgi:hypothetical protein